MNCSLIISEAAASRHNIVKFGTQAPSEDQQNEETVAKKFSFTSQRVCGVVNNFGAKIFRQNILCTVSCNIFKKNSRRS